MDQLQDPDRLAGGVIVGGFDGTTLPPDVRARLGEGLLAGVTLFKRNITDPFQCRELCAALADAAGTDLPAVISIDQEGGRVARLGPPVTVLPPMRALGRIDDPDLTRRAARVVGVELAAIGINLDFAPVCDVDSNPANPVIGDRSFGRTPDVVTRHALAFLEGLQGAGVLGCAKHYPGHGDTETDSHLELPRVRHDRARLDATELPPFHAAMRAGVASVMTAHVVFDALAPDTPATLSRAVLAGLRAATGYDGVVFSDDLHMKALSARWSMEESAVLALDAGCDGLLVCSDPDAQERARRAVAREARASPVFLARLREAHARMARLRRRAPPSPAPDREALAAVLARDEHARLLDEVTRRAAG